MADGVEPVRVFVSYAHDDVEHVDRVRNFWLFLRFQGLDAQLDLPAAEEPRDWTLWMGQELRSCRFVLVVASPEYKRRAEGDAAPGEGSGVQWEAALIRALLYADQEVNRRRVIPVVLPGCDPADIPDWLTPASSTYYRVIEYSVAGAERLLRVLTGQPYETVPPLGRVPGLPGRPLMLGVVRPVGRLWGSRSPRRVIAYWCLALGVAVVVGGLRFFPPGRVNLAAAVVAAVFAVLAVVVALPGGLSAAERLSTPEQLDAAAGLLAREVLRQWREEVARRGLAGGPPLTVRWSVTGQPVADDVGAVAAAVAGPAGAGRVVRLRLSGSVERVVAEFRRLAVPRVVVLGVPGAGKTSLLALLTVGLLEQTSETGHVPVLLTLSSWDPAAEDLYGWMARRLTEDYVGLGNVRAYGGSAARDLLADHRLLPVLDGLDEMPAASRAAALSAINDLPASAPLVLACRTAEYTEAVRAGGTLRAAPVVELEPVGVDAALAWLRTGSARTVDAARARIEADGAGGPLSGVLGTPLMVFLVRAVYQTAQRDPAELVDRVRFPDQAAIERHLLEQYVPVVFTENLRRRPSGRRGGTPPVSRQEWSPRPWAPDRAVAWLAFLAGHLAQRRDDDLSWWQVRHRSRALGTVMAVTVGTIAGVAFGMVAGTAFGLAPGLRYGIAFGVVFAVMFGFCQALTARHGPMVGSRSRRLPRGLSARITCVAGRLVAGVVGGLFAGLASLASQALGAPVGFAVLGLVFGLTSMMRPTARQAAGASMLTPPSRVFDGLVLGLVGWPAALLVLGFTQARTWGLLLNARSAGNSLAGHGVELHAGLLFGSVQQLRACLLFGLVFGLMCAAVGWFAGLAAQVGRAGPPASRRGGSRRARWATGLSVLSGAAGGGLLGGLILGLAGDPVAGVASGLGFGAAVALAHHRQEMPGAGPADPILLNVAGRAAAGILGGIAGGLLFHFTGRLATGAPGRLEYDVVQTLAGGLVAGLGTGIALGVGLGLLFGLAGVAVGRPARLSLRIRGRARALLLSLAGGLAGGVAAAAVLTVIFTSDFSIRSGAGRTAAFGLLGGVAAGLGSWLLVPAPEARTAGPSSTLRADRTATLAGGVMAGMVAGAVTALAAEAAWGLLVSLALAVTVAWGTSWTDFSLARARLAMLRRTPWRLMTFLDDARHLGVLRQVGPVYQFRHTRLREQLAQRGSEPAPANSSTQRLADPREQEGVRSSGSPARQAIRRALAHVTLAAAVLGAAALARAYHPQPGHPADPTLQAITARPPIYDNPLRHNDGAWDDYDECKFENAAYHVRTDPSFYTENVCMGPKLLTPELGAAAFRVRMTINSGDEGGIDLDSYDQPDCVYYVRSTGAYELFSFDPRTSRSTTIQFGFSPAVRTGLGKENTLAVVAQTDTALFYVNDVFVLSTDRCGSDRLIGLWATATTARADVEFTHAQGWQT